MTECHKEPPVIPDDLTPEQAADALSAQTQEHEAWERGRKHGIRPRADQLTPPEAD